MGALRLKNNAGIKGMSQILYRGMDRAEIDFQLDLRARWPDHEASFARWARESEQVRARLSCRLDLSYGQSPGCRLDLFPAPGARRPLLAFIHGGYWQSFDKGDFSALAPSFTDAGITFASLNYDLAPGVRLGEIVAQIRQALTWLHGEAAALGFDPDRIFVAGHSAGGHLAIMAASGLAEDLIKGICSVSGVYDLRPIRLSYHQDVLDLTLEEAEALSPVLRVPAQAPPLICAVGSEETEEFLIQQDELVAAWRAGGLSARTVDLPGRQHFSAIDAFGEKDHPLFQAVRTLVRTGS